MGAFCAHAFEPASALWQYEAALVWALGGTGGGAGSCLKGASCSRCAAGVHVKSRWCTSAAR
jgi:hypothetical protein